MLDNGADVNRADQNGRTPLYSACVRDQPNAARLLLEKGANVDRAMENGWTPLDAAKI